jgi:glycosyltransferase, group 2 family protein
MSKISVLVAVYNTEKYLRQCLDSLLGQTLDDIEIICVDDASTDSSPDILREYIAADNRIKLITLKENRGQAHARNQALKISTGEYIAFLDSDDYLASDALEQIVGTFDRHPTTDAVLFKVINIFPDANETPYPMPEFEQMNGYDAFVDSLTWKIHGVYAVRRSIHLKFPYDETARAFSDDNTTRLHYLNSRHVRLSRGIYYYRQHPQSVTHSISLRRFDYLLANESMKRQLLQLHSSSEILDIYENVRWLNLVDLYMFYYLHRRHFSLDARRQALSRLRHTRLTIETSRLRPSLRHKFGYRVMPSWPLFRLQEELYFFLRSLVGRNRESSQGR